MRFFSNKGVEVLQGVSGFNLTDLIALIRADTLSVAKDLTG